MRTFLCACNLERYFDKFVEEGYDDLPFLKSLHGEDAMLKDMLKELCTRVGLKPGHMARFVAALERAAKEAASCCGVRREHTHTYVIRESLETADGASRPRASIFE